MNIATSSSPKASVVLPHYAFAAVAFLILNILLFFSREALVGHYFHPKLLSITHIAVLGWGVMTIFGALYQLLPVILGVSLYSEILAKVTFLLLGTGTILLTFCFWVFEIGLMMQIASILVLTAIACFNLNIYLTTSRSKEWKTETDFILTSCFWLLLTATAGVLMVFNFRFPFLPDSHLSYLKLHAHLGIAGWFLLLIMGVSSRLFPMFLLAHHTKTSLLNYCYYLINIGLLGFILHQFLRFPDYLILIWVGFVTVAISLFIWYCFDAFKSRLRKELDHPMKITMVAVTLLLLPIGLLFFLNLYAGTTEKIYLQISLAYGVSIFLGYITALILGQTFKTLPFIVWIHKYQKHVGKTKTPLPKDLYSQRFLLWQNLSYLLGFLILIAGIVSAQENLLKIGSFLFILTGLFYFINVYKVLLHMIKS